jgi:DnaJ-class molecular chaperone
VLGDPQQRQQYDNPATHQSFNLHDIFAQSGVDGFNPFQDIIRDMMNQRRGQGQKLYTTTMVITLEQVALGGKETLNIQTNDGNRLFDVEIPAGIEDGTTLRYIGMMPDGLVQITFRVQPHAVFERRNHHLAVRKEINIFDFIIGTTVIIDDIYGRTLEVTIPPRTVPGQEFRIPGRGLPSQFGIGDLYILSSAVIPATISEPLIESIRTERKQL